MSEQEFLDVLRSIEGRLNDLQSWAAKCKENVKKGTLKNLELIKETDRRLADTIENLRVSFFSS